MTRVLLSTVLCTEANHATHLDRGTEDILTFCSMTILSNLPPALRVLDSHSLDSYESIQLQ